MEELNPNTIKERLMKNDIVLVDIRSKAEYRFEHIEGAINLPINDLDKFDFTGKDAVFYCLSGMRTKNNSVKLNTLKCNNCYIMKGGINEWKKSGYSTEKLLKHSIPVMQQVQIFISLILLVSLLLTYVVSPWFLLIILFVAFGLMFAGLTGFCGMAVLLSKMPWNKPK